MKIFKMSFDNQLNEDGSEKPNKLLGEFDLISGNMDDYSYEVIVKSIDDNELYILIGTEVSGFYNKGMGGTKNSISRLSDNWIVKAYLDNFTPNLDIPCFEGTLNNLDNLTIKK